MTWFLEEILEGFEWSDLSKARLGHYIYQLQSRKATGADWSIVWAYLDALKDNRLITDEQKRLLLKLANEVHSNLAKHFEPYEKIPWKVISETIDKISKGELPDEHYSHTRR